MILRKLQLRGAKGIKYGLGLDEIEIDFTKFQPGLVAITGRNGSGKTTLLENLTPFRSLFSRKGKLQGHFFLPDSHRILTFQIGEDIYRAEVYVDAQKDKAGAALYKNDKDIATSPREYDAEIDKLFLGKSLFEQSLFFGQDTERISDLRAGEAKEFMIKLLRLDMAQALHKRASLYTNDALKAFESKENTQRDLMNKIGATENLQEELTKAEKDLATHKRAEELGNKALEKVKKQLQSEEELQRLEVELQDKLDELENWHAKNTARHAKHSDMLKLYSKETLHETLRKYHESLDPVTEEAYNEYRALEESRNTLNEKKNAFLERMQKAQEEYSEIETSRNAHCSSIEKAIDRIRIRRAQALDAASVIEEVPCNEEMGKKCPLLTSANEARNLIDPLYDELKNAEAQLQEARAYKKDESDSLQERIDLIKNKLSTVSDELEEVTQKLSDAGNVDHHWKVKQNQLRAIDEVQHKIQTCDEVLEKEESDYENFKDIARDTMGKLHKAKEEISTKMIEIHKTFDFETLREKKLFYETNLREKRSLIEQTATLVGQLNQRIQDAEQLKEDLKNAKRATRVALNNLGSWRTIEKAFGKDGIQAFEIKKALPAIVKMMNELLIGELGQKFSLNFRMKRHGTKGQLINTFDPLITRYADEEVLEENVPLTNLSRGERILVFVAMSEAVGVYLRNSIGLDLKTSFVDEADGPLDPSNRSDYLRTRTHVHDLCGLYHTFIISQSPDIYEQIPQKLILKKGQVEVVV